MELLCGSVHKLVIEELEQYFPLRTEQASSITYNIFNSKTQANKYNCMQFISFCLENSPTPSTEKNVDIKVEPEEAEVVKKGNTTDKIQVVVEKITPPSSTIQPTNSKLNPVTISVENVTPNGAKSIKMQIEKLNPDVGAKEKTDEDKSENVLRVEKIVTPEEAKTEMKVKKLTSAKSEATEDKIVSVEKISSQKETNQEGVNRGGVGKEEEVRSSESAVVEKVEEPENEKEEKIPVQISVEKIANDEEDTDEEMDLAGGRTEGREEAEAVVSVEKISSERKSEEMVGGANEVNAKVEKLTDELAVKGPNQITVEKVENNEEDTDDGRGRNDERETVVSVEKISPEGEVQKQMVGNAITIRVEKVTDKVGETKETTSEPNQITVEKVANEEPENEEVDLESYGNSKGKSEVSENEEKRKGNQVEEVKERQERDQVPVQVAVEHLVDDEGEGEERDLEIAGMGEAVNAEIQVEKAKEAEKKESVPGLVTVEKVITDAAEEEEMDLEREGKPEERETEKLKEAEEKDKAPGKSVVEKLANVDVDDEKVDLESGSNFKRQMAKSAGKVKAKKVADVKEKQGKVMVTVEKVEPVLSKMSTESKGSQTQQKAAEEEDLEVDVEKLPKETSPAKDVNPIAESGKEISVEVEKVQSSIPDSREEGGDSEPKFEVTVEKLEASEASVKPTAKSEERTSKRADEENTSPSKLPASESSPISEVRVEKIPSEEVNEGKPSDGISRDATQPESRQEEENELEDEELETYEETPEEQKFALEFEKALEAERNKKDKTQPTKLNSPIIGPVTTEPNEPYGTEAMRKESKEKEEEPENQKAKAASESKSKKGMSLEELELASLAEQALKDYKEEMKLVTATEAAPTITATTEAEKVVVVEVEKQPKVTVTVTKENNEVLLSEKQTAQEEKRLKEELSKELEQEKSEVSVL